MRIFLAGIMQGSHREAVLHEQNYRQRLQAAIQQHLPAAQLHDPLADHQQSLSYDDATGREVFLFHNRLCREVEVVIAFVPEASMGTAIEMWEAHEHGRGVVVTISPLAHNWVVRFCSDFIFPSLDSFEQACRGGFVDRLQDAVRRRAGRPGSSVA